ncbi:MAG: ribonuclease HII [Bacillaceae bacterium]|nr:ribonuclease HII [Bacillaceae bacterium]
MKKSIKEIEITLSNMTEIDKKFLEEIKNDERKGVQRALVKWKKEQEKRLQLIEQFEQMSVYEKELYDKGVRYIAGIDEVGRGPLVGPVVAAAVILPVEFKLYGLTDSKKLSKEKRDDFYEIINREAIAVGVGIITPAKIDQVNIYEATKLAMLQAIHQLNVQAEHLLIDAMRLPIAIEQTSIVKGDSKSISIAASSVIAKVTRDKVMENLHLKYPQYGFNKNMGYPTAEHLQAIEEHGICSEHRRSFGPVRDKCRTNSLF